MGISNVIQIPDNLQQLQRFLEQCLSSDSPSAEFIESLVTLAQFKGESLEIVKQKILVAGEKLSVIVSLQRQVSKHAAQFSQFLKNSCDPELVQNPNISPSSLEAYAVSFSSEIVDLLIQNHFETACKRNCTLAEYFDVYWDYSFDKAQELILDIFQFESEFKNRIFAVQELNDSYQASFSLVEISAAKILNSDSLRPKLRLPASFSPKSESTTSDNNVQKDTLDRYTLEELLENVTPENYHEQTDWGKVVGNEIW